MTIPMQRHGVALGPRRARAPWVTLVVAPLVLLSARAEAVQPPESVASAPVCESRTLFGVPQWGLLCTAHLEFTQGVKTAPKNDESRKVKRALYDRALKNYDAAVKGFEELRRTQRRTYANTLGLLLGLVSRNQVEIEIDRMKEDEKLARATTAEAKEVAKKEIAQESYTVPAKDIDDEMRLFDELKHVFPLEYHRRAYGQIGTAIKHIEENARTANITISSNVDGEIHIDGVHFGRIEHSRPPTFWMRARSRHDVSVKQDGFKSRSIDIMVGDSREVRVDLDPLPANALLVVDVRRNGVGDEANVFIDSGTRFGRTRCSATPDSAPPSPSGGSSPGKCIATGLQNPGEHVLWARQGDDWGSKPVSVDANGGKPEPVTLDLLPLGREVVVKASQATAEISVDYYDKAPNKGSRPHHHVTLGRSSWRGRLPFGRYEFRATNDGYRADSHVVDVLEHDSGSDPIEVQLNLTKPAIVPDLMLVEFLGGYLGGTSFGGLRADDPSTHCSIMSRRHAVNGVTGSARLEFRLASVINGFPRGFGFGVEAGGLGAWQSVDRDLVCPGAPGTPPARYTIHDKLAFRGPFVGPTASWRLPLHLRSRLPGDPPVELAARVLAGWMVPAFSGDPVQATVSTPGDSTGARVEGTSATLWSSRFFLRPEVGLELVWYGFRLRVGLGASIFTGTGPTFSHREISVASPRGCAKDSDAACARASSALKDEPAYGTFVLFSPQLAFILAP